MLLDGSMLGQSIATMNQFILQLLKIQQTAIDADTVKSSGTAGTH